MSTTSCARLQASATTRLRRSPCWPATLFALLDANVRRVLTHLLEDGRISGRRGDRRRARGPRPCFPDTTDGGHLVDRPHGAGRPCLHGRPATLAGPAAECPAPGARPATRRPTVRAEGPDRRHRSPVPRQVARRAGRTSRSRRGRRPGGCDLAWPRANSGSGASRACSRTGWWSRSSIKHPSLVEPSAPSLGERRRHRQAGPGGSLASAAAAAHRASRGTRPCLPRGSPPGCARPQPVDLLEEAEVAQRGEVVLGRALEVAVGFGRACSAVIPCRSSCTTLPPLARGCRIERLRRLEDRCPLAHEVLAEQLVVQQPQPGIPGSCSVLSVSTTW